MEKKYLFLSAALHIAVFLLCIFDISFFTKKHDFDETPPIMVNLDDVTISDMTNLPELAVRGEENKPATRKDEPIPEQAAQQKPKSEPEPQIKDEPEPEPEAPEIKAPSLIEEAPKMEDTKDEPSKEDKKPEKKKPAPIPQRKPELKPNKKPEKKPEPKKDNKPTTPNTNNKPTVNSANPLESLFKASDDLQKQIGERDAPAQVRKDAPVNNLGIEGGNSKGSYFSDITVSGIDFVKSKIQESWKTSAIGSKDERNIEVVINVKIAKEGIIQSVDIENMGRYRSDSAFRALADSAERAIYIAQDSFDVFKVLAKQSASRYNEWKEIRFTFTPLGLATKK